MLKLVQVGAAKCRDEILDEFVLRLLFQCHPQQFEIFWWNTLAGIVRKAKITRETNLEVLDGKLIQPAVVQTLHSQRDDRLDFVTFRAEGGDELARQVLVQQDFHADCNAF